MSSPRPILLAIILSIASAVPSLAVPVDKNPDANGNGWGPGGKMALGVPAPVVGAGLPFLILAGGYFWIRRRRQH
jgi:hypothetical protein